MPKNHSTATTEFVDPPAKHRKINPINSTSPINNFTQDQVIVHCVATFLTNSVNDLLSFSLVNKTISSVVNGNDSIWSKVSSKYYVKRSPLSDNLEKDPINGPILSDLYSRFSCKEKAIFALKQSYAKLKIHPAINVFHKYREMFEEGDEGYVYKEGEENFEPTTELKQIISNWGERDECEEGNMYGYFFYMELENDVINVIRFENLLTGQVYKCIHAEEGNSYGSFHLEDDERQFASHSEGSIMVDSECSLNNEGVQVDIDLLFWLERLFSKVTDCPEHPVYYGGESYDISESIIGGESNATSSTADESDD